MGHVRVRRLENDTVVSDATGGLARFVKPDCIPHRPCKSGVVLAGMAGLLHFLRAGGTSEKVAQP